MNNESSWKPTKFVQVDGELHANSDSKYVSVSSRLNVELLAASLSLQLKRFASGRFLDLGCGSVPLYAAYKDRASEIVCVDWSNTAHGMEHIDIPADLNLPLPLPLGRFETVLLTDVLEHIAEPQALIAEIRRILVKGGMLVGSVPFMYWIHEEPHDHYRYTVHALRRMAESKGFSIEVLEPYGAGTDVLFDVMGKIFNSSHSRIALWLAGYIQKIGLAARRLKPISRLNGRLSPLPLGYVFVFRAVDM